MYTYEVVSRTSDFSNSTTLSRLNGFVLPSLCITETQIRLHWESKTSTEEEYVFYYRDLARYNIMVSAEILEVTYIYNWEYAGFFLSILEVTAWYINCTEYWNMFEDTDRIEAESSSSRE